VGAITAALTTGDFIDRLTDVGKPGLLAGSVMQVVGLITAVAGGLAMVLGRRETPAGRAEV
jgi:hypothetical protein